MPPESSREPIHAQSWEGDKMFNIYIYDYCLKRGFRKTARELMIEADLGNDAAPPINARQGLLFEWWSVFWVLFQAKSGNSSHEDALLYIQHQNLQKAQRMQAVPNQPQQPGVSIPLGNQPQPSSNPQSQSQAPVRGMPNGMPLQRQPSYHTNGAMPNGINPVMGGQPSQPGQMVQQPMQGQPGGALIFGGIGGQPNGIAAAQHPPPPPPPQGGSQQPGTHSMSFNPMMSAQRPTMNGQPQQTGPQQPRGPFTSPPMAHSPQGGSGVGQPSQGPPPGQPGPPAPMAQLGPSPQMTPMPRSMLPPNGAHPMSGPMNLPTPQQGAPPNSAFNPGPRPRSRPTPSPSMSARQPPNAAPQQHGMGMMSMGPMQGAPSMGVINLGGMGGGVGGSLNPDHITYEFGMIPSMALSNLKHEFGFGDKDLNISDKAQLLTFWKQRGPGAQQQARKDGTGQPGMLPPGQPPQQQRPQPQQAGSNNRLKRNSSSPHEELQNEPRNESSPPDRKRVKRSPAQPPAVPPGYPLHLQPTSGQPAPTQQQNPIPLNSQSGPPGPGVNPQAQMQQHAHMMMIRQQMAMSGTGGPVPGGQPGQGKPGGAAQTPTGPQGVPMHPSQMHHNLFRGGPPGPAAGRTSGGPQFHPVPLTQLATKHGMPANSPGMNGPPKDGAKEIKRPQSNGQPQQGNQQGPDASPRNTSTGTAPPTPGASNQPTPGLPPSNLPPAPASGGSGAPQQPPMPSMLSMPMNIPGMNPGDFMFETTLMEDFDAFAKQEGDLNFERDFGQWFNTAEDGAGLELK